MYEDLRRLRQKMNIIKEKSRKADFEISKNNNLLVSMLQDICSFYAKMKNITCFNSQFYYTLEINKILQELISIMRININLAVYEYTV